MLFRPLGHRTNPGRWLIAGALALTSILWPDAEQVLAQPSAQWSPLAAAPGDEINLFADWTASQPTDGLTIDVRDGWDVVAVEAVGLGRNDRVSFTLRRTVQGLFAEADERLLGRHRLIITLHAPNRPSSSTLSVVPSVLVDDAEGLRLEPIPRHEVEFDLKVESGRLASGRALRLSAAAGREVSAPTPMRLEAPEATGLTVAFWMKSVDLGHVVLSSWDGGRHLDYPFEFVVEPSGEVRVYTSEAGMHYSLGSGEPVTDGDWHHIAYSIRFSDGFALMTVDGHEVDSRFLPGTDDMALQDVAFGSRLHEDVEFNGLIDELLLAPRALTSTEIDRWSRVPLQALELESGAISFGFDTRRARASVRGTQEEVDFVSSDLTLHQPATDVVAEFRPGRVLLNWTLDFPEAQVMTVERSKDGLVFDQIHEVAIAQSDLDRLQQGELFSFEDFIPEDARVSFYRIRQEFADKSTIQSAMIKVGMGALEVPTTVELVGNSPNPFSTTTEVYYRVDHAQQVRLSVWSISGHLAEVLATGTQEPGLHRVAFDAGGLPSGTYFLRLESEEGVQTGKMILRR